MIEIVKITNRDIPQIQLLAREIWDEHYTPIIGKAQIDYMLEKFYNIDKIKSEIKNGSYWEMVIENKIPVGYLACELEAQSVYLSKIYLKNKFRGKGFGRIMIDRVKKIGIQNQKKYIYLNVNKENTGSIEFYVNCGFRKTAEQVTDIGNGFVMDDYLFELEL